MALGIAFRAFFAALGNRQTSERIRLALEQRTAVTALPSPVRDVVSPSSVVEKVSDPDGAKHPEGRSGHRGQTPFSQASQKLPLRSDAITLLSTLQREARLLDLVKENLSAYSDAQVGAAARPCLTQCAATLDRLLGIKAIESVSDGQTVAVPETATSSRYTWIGEGSGASGKLIHHGWEASRLDLPQWTGADADAKVIAPAQVQRA